MLKDSVKILNELITLGGAGRLEDAKNSYQAAYEKYIVIYNDAAARKAEIEENIKAMGNALTQARCFLEKYEKIVKGGIEGENNLSFKFPAKTLNKIDKFNAQMNSVLTVGVGSIAGGSLAVGSWALVAAAGSASTGVAISGLSGVAATNATLAWFGGGALAAGGTGMAGGMTVLGGIFAVPLVCIAAKSTHKKAKELEEAKIKIEDATHETLGQIDALRQMLELVKLRRSETNVLCYTLIEDIIKFTRIIRPNGIFSSIKQKILSYFGLPPYTQEQIAASQQLDLSVSIFLESFRMGND